MKKIIIIVVTLFLTSCIKNYYQIFTASSENSKTKSGLIVFEDKNCTVSYNLWSFQGSSDFVFYNKTDQDITIDFTKTFFVLNEYSNPYYQNKTYSSTLSNKVTANSYYKTYSISKDASTTISYGDQTATVIPSKTKRLISKFQIVDTLFFHCDLVRKATRSNPGTVKFDKSTSPIIFSNIITYKIGEEINKI